MAQGVVVDCSDMMDEVLVLEGWFDKVVPVDNVFELPVLLFLLKRTVEADEVVLVEAVDDTMPTSLGCLWYAFQGIS